MKSITSIALLVTLQLGLTGCALRQTCCTRESNCGDVSGGSEISAPDAPATQPNPFVPDVETSPSDLPAAEAPAASEQAAERTSEPAARTATRPSRTDEPMPLVPAQNPQILFHVEG